MSYMNDFIEGHTVEFALQESEGELDLLVKIKCPHADNERDVPCKPHGSSKCLVVDQHDMVGSELFTITNLIELGEFKIDRVTGDYEEPYFEVEGNMI